LTRGTLLTTDIQPEMLAIAAQRLTKKNLPILSAGWATVFPCHTPSNNLISVYGHGLW
jgi:hypothetical protein